MGNVTTCQKISEEDDDDDNEDD